MKPQMKPQKQKKFHILSLLLTLLAGAAILGAGYLLISSMQYWIPSYKNKMTYMGQEHVQMQPLYWSREEEVTIYPWGLYKSGTAAPLTEEDTALLRGVQLDGLLSRAASAAEQVDFVSAFQKVTSNNVPVYFLKDFVCTGYTDAQETLSSGGERAATEKTVSCAVDQYGQLLYLQVTDKDRAARTADRGEMEKTYNSFSALRDTEDSAENSLLDKAARRLYDLFSSNAHQHKAARVLETFFFADRGAYDVVLQDQQILLIYTFDSGYRAIFIYHVPMGEITGVSLEKLSV